MINVLDKSLDCAHAVPATTLALPQTNPVQPIT